jgi:hypothetical protein
MSDVAFLIRLCLFSCHFKDQTWHSKRSPTHPQSNIRPPRSISKNTVQKLPQPSCFTHYNSIIVISCRRQAAAAVILMTSNLRLQRLATQQQGQRKKFIKQQSGTSGSFDFPQLATPFGKEDHENGGRRLRNHHQFHQRAQSKPDCGYGDAAGGGSGMSLSLMTTTTITD